MTFNNIPGSDNRKCLVGKFSQDVISALGLGIVPGTPIFISGNNVRHIREHHPDAYMKYYDRLAEVLSNPDYVGIAGVQAPSVEYVKAIQLGGEYVNVAVRATRRGIYYVRSMFIIESGRINDYVKKGKLIRLT